MRLFKAITTSLLVLSIITVSACSTDQGGPTQPTVSDPTNPGNGNTAENPQQTAPTEANTGDQSREEKIKALRDLIPEGFTKKPESIEEFLSLPPGRFAGMEYKEHSQEVNEVLRQLPNIENPDEEIMEMYYLALLGLFAEVYPDPQQMIDQIKLVSFGNPEIDDPRYQFKDQYNVEIILDASGSMAESVGGKTRMEAAKEAIKEFAKNLPKQARVSLRVYGHKGSGKESDKSLSCSSSELVYGLQPYNEQKLQASLDQFKPTGYTPIAFALQEAMKDFSNISGEKNTNIIYLVSDGIETCDGNPVEMAKKLAESKITPIVNVIGFGVDGPGQKQLKEIASAAKGRYIHIQNQDQLQKEFKQAEAIAEKWEKWRSNAMDDSFSKNLERTSDILGFAYDWWSTAFQQTNNMFSAITHIESLNTVPEEVTKELSRWNDQDYKMFEKHGNELEKFLDSLNEKTYKEAIEAINKKFSENVGTN